ncbi:hypothetical protein [Klebsiella pneumoniae]|uniref:hypothetical protein n=1 Tax=Klebsiella pneumoniae TaxID=573 RepID=UPI00396F4F92
MLALKGRGVNLNCFIEKMKTGTGMDKRYNTGNSRPSNSMKDLNDNALAYDDFLNSESDTFIDRFGNAKDTMIGATKKMAAATDAVIDEARQNLIPLSKQYMTLADAQADIANIPAGSTTYYRSPDDSALAIEVMNVGGTLTATGRTMASGELVAKIDNRISESEGEHIVEIHDSEKNIVGLLDKDGYFFLPYLPASVQNTINRLLSLVSSRSGSDIFRLGDGENDTFIQDCDGRVFVPLLNLSIQDYFKYIESYASLTTGDDILRFGDGEHDTLIQANDGRLYLPLLADSVQDEINNLKNNQTPESSAVPVDTRNQVNTAAYIDIPDGYYAEKIKWLRDNVAIPDATGYAYTLTADDVAKNITVSVGVLLGGNRVSDKTTGQIGGMALESAGPGGSIYEGYTLSAGDDFNTLDILSPANPKGRWFTTRTYLNPPRGSDTQLGTMYDTDPAFTGFNDSNRGVPVGFDNMRVEGGVLRLQARAATANEKPHLQGSRHDLAAMVSSVGAFSFFAGPAGTGDCIIEWYAMFTHETQNPPGWHPSLWTQSSLPSYTYNSDELDIIEGTSQFATSNYNLWGADGSKRGGGKLGPEKHIFDGKYHKISAILNQSSVQIFIDDTFSSTLALDANSVREPGYLLMSSHVYKGTFHGETYSNWAWEKLWKGATISVDWCRIWRKTGLSHIKPRVTVPSVNIDYGSSGTIVLPAKSVLWGRDDVSEHVQTVMTEENEPGGSHTVSYDSLPPFVTYNELTRTITIGNGYTKAGRLNFVIYGYLQDGSSCEPARTWANIGPHYSGSTLTLGPGKSVDLYPLWDCGVLVTDGEKCTKTIGVYSLPEGVIFDTKSCRLINFGGEKGSYVITSACQNSIGQTAVQKINLILN